MLDKKYEKEKQKCKITARRRKNFEKGIDK